MRILHFEIIKEIMVHDHLNQLSKQIAMTSKSRIKQITNQNLYS